MAGAAAGAAAPRAQVARQGKVVPVEGVVAGVVVTVSSPATPAQRLLLVAPISLSMTPAAKASAIVPATASRNRRTAGHGRPGPAVSRAGGGGGYRVTGTVTTVGGSASDSGGNGIMTTVMLSRPPESSANFAM